MHTLRSVVYRHGALEHFMVDGDTLTLCGRTPEHINSATVQNLPPRDLVPGNYCRICVKRGREATTV